MVKHAFLTVKNEIVNFRKTATLKKQCESRNYSVTVLELDEVTSVEDLQSMDPGKA